MNLTFGLFQNEMKKMMRSRIIWFAAAAMLGFSLIYALTSLTEYQQTGALSLVRNIYGVSIYGYGRFLLDIKDIPFYFIFMAPIIAEMTTKEFDRGTIKNSLSRGVGRGQYFCVKLCSLTCFLTLLHMLRCLLGAGAVTIANGFNLLGFQYPEYGKALVVCFLGGLLNLYLGTGIILCMAFLLRRTAAVGLMGLVMVFADVDVLRRFTSLPTPTRFSLDMIEIYWTQGKLLTAEFFRLAMPYICLLLLPYLLAWLVFRKREAD